MENVQHLRGTHQNTHMCVLDSFVAFGAHFVFDVSVFFTFSVVYFTHSPTHPYPCKAHSTQQHNLNSNAFKRIIFRAIQVSVCYRFSFASLFLLIRILFAWLYTVPQQPLPSSPANRSHFTLYRHGVCGTEFCELFLGLDVYIVCSINSIFSRFPMYVNNNATEKHELLNYWVQLLLFQNVNVNQCNHFCGGYSNFYMSNRA